MCRVITLFFINNIRPKVVKLSKNVIIALTQDFVLIFRVLLAASIHSQGEVTLFDEFKGMR
jgi:hypothetical protein